MSINWKKVWQEFDDELSNRLQEGVLNEWSMQQEIIERVVERNPRALDGLYCQLCGEPLSEHFVTERGGHCQPARR